jgi:hypothetical protein
VVIRNSRAGEIDRLVAALSGDDSVQREGAVARLRVIGDRAVARLAALLASDALPVARAAALEALIDSEDPRTVDLGLDNLAHAEADVAVAAVGVLRGWVTRESGTRVLDAVTAAALDQSRHARVRLAALDALSSLPRAMVQPVLEQAASQNTSDSQDRGTRTLERDLDDPLGAREWLLAHQGTPLSELHEFVVHAREREQKEPSARRRQDWLVTRGAAHALLARRGSRVALYDLRETFDAARGALPLDFLTAVAQIGDPTCLEPMARAWDAAPAADTWWRERLTDAATDIVHRTRLSGRSALMKRLRAKFPGFT